MQNKMELGDDKHLLGDLNGNGKDRDRPGDRERRDRDRSRERKDRERSRDHDRRAYLFIVFSIRLSNHLFSKVAVVMTIGSQMYVICAVLSFCPC